MSGAAAEILICNETTIDLYRHFHNLVHGEWLMVPAEAIAAGNSAQCSCQSTRGFGGFHGKLQYNFVIQNVEYIIGAMFQQPVVGQVLTTVMVGCDRDDVGLPPIGDLMAIDWRKAPERARQFEITIRETPAGKKKFEEYREEIRSSWAQLNKELSGFGFSCVGVLPPASIMQKTQTKVPRHFVRNIRNVGWVERLRDSHRSIRIRLVNLTKERLVFCGSRRLHLVDGQWIEFPSESIVSGSCCECGIQCDGFFGGSQGTISYSIVGSQGQRRINVSWEQRVQVFLVSIEQQKCKNLSIVKHCETHNQASAHIHVLDPSNLPKIELLSAYIVSPTALGQGVSTEQFLARSGSQDSLLSHPETVTATQELIQFLRRSDAGHNVEPTANAPGASWRYAATEVTIPVARTFICHCQLSTPDWSKIAPNSYLLLEWQIGCEVFWKLWKSDQTVWLYAAIAGGVDDEHTVMHAQRVANLRVPPASLLGIEKGRSPISHQLSVEGDLFPRTYAPLSRDDLLNCLVTAMQILALGLQSLAVPLMRATYGDDWINSQCQVPKDYLWKEVLQSDVHFDLEGIMFVLISRWDDLFQPVFEKAGFTFESIQTIQKSSVCWTNQELSRFDDETVMKFLELSCDLLRALKQNSCSAKIRDLYTSVFENPLQQLPPPSPQIRSASSSMSKMSTIELAHAALTKMSTIEEGPAAAGQTPSPKINSPVVKENKDKLP